MKYFAWNPEKNERLKQERGVGFEAVVFHTERGDLLDMPRCSARNIPLAHCVLVSVCLVPQKNFGPKERGRQLKGQRVALRIEVVCCGFRVSRDFCNAAVAPVIGNELGILLIFLSKPSIRDSSEDGLLRAARAYNLYAARVGPA
jgi:hypothetical protein